VRLPRRGHFNAPLTAPTGGVHPAIAPTGVHTPEGGVRLPPPWGHGGALKRGVQIPLFNVCA